MNGLEPEGVGQKLMVQAGQEAKLPELGTSWDEAIEIAETIAESLTIVRSSERQPQCYLMSL